MPGLLAVREQLSRVITRHSAPPLRPLGEDGLAPILGPSPGAVTLCTLEGRFIEVSDTFLRATRYSRSEVVGRTGSELGLWAEPCEELERLQRVLRVEGEIREREFSYRTKSGELRVMLISAELITLRGRPCVLSVGVDVTEIRAAGPSKI